MIRILFIALFLTATNSLAETAKVTRVIDGDTFIIDSGERVRLIGINAPEISDFYGKESKEYLAALIENKIVELENDRLAKDKDVYQRLLRYVFFEGIEINKRLIEDGFAFAYLKYKFSKSSEYEQTQVESMELNRGIWGDANQTKEEIKVKENFDNQKFDIYDLSIKAYFLIAIISFLLMFGLFYYFKK